MGVWICCGAAGERLPRGGAAAQEALRIWRKERAPYFFAAGFEAAFWGTGFCAAAAGTATPSGPLASTLRQSLGSSSMDIGGLAGAGGGRGPGGIGAGTFGFTRASQFVRSLPQPSSFPTGGCASQLVLPFGQWMRMWK